MTTIYKNQDFEIQFNNSCTYFIIDCNDTCWGTYPTLRRANNAMKTICKGYNMTF